ncbi:reverse transcriptase domain-containing protein, partial [Tanacetum coccineum]
ISEFKTFSIENIPREDNQKADILSKLATILVEVLNERSTDAKEVQTIVEEEGENWMTPIIKYLEEGIVPSDKNEARSLRHLQANYVIREIHMGSCGMHIGLRAVVRFGLPRIIVTDNGAQLVNEPFKAWLEVKQASEGLHNIPGLVKAKLKTQAKNSKLTQLLQDSLGGESKTLMFVQISPSDNDQSETLSSLNFATRVRGVELDPARKQIDTIELQKMKMMVKELENKLIEREQSGAVKDPKDKLNLQVRESKSYTMTLQDKIEELEKKLKEQEQNSDSTSLRLKIKELEGKPKDQVTIADSSSSMKTTPREADTHILRSSNIMNRQTVASFNRVVQPEWLNQRPAPAAQRPVNLRRPSVAQGVKDRESKERTWA